MELEDLLNEKAPNGSYIVKKENRLKVIKGALLLRRIYKEKKNG